VIIQPGGYFAFQQQEDATPKGVLVVALPCPHEGGQLSIIQLLGDRKEKVGYTLSFVFCLF
jgi:hypothetical protein